MPAIPYKKTGTTDVAWDAQANIDRLNANDEKSYRQMFAWVDPKGDPSVKGSYKFPHHMVGANGEVGDANLAACSAGIGALNGARGHADIPSTDRHGVWEALAGHLIDAGKTPPELRSEEVLDHEVELVLRSMVGENNMVVERRMITDTEFRILGDGAESMRIDGHPAVFNRSADLGFFIERMAPGAFTRTIQEDDVRALINHDPNLLLARKGAGTMILSEDQQGLRTEVDVAPTSYGKDLLVNMRLKNINQGSIGFIARGQKVTKQDGNWVRELTDVKLRDAGPVTFPAYNETDYSARSFDAALKSFRNGPDGRTWEDPDEWKRDVERRARLLQLAEI
jgi:uncharacterized protein